MNKNFLRAAALSALLAFGANGAMAQNRSYNCAEISAEYKEVADQVIALNLEDPDKANKLFMNLHKKVKKSKEDLVSVGTYYLEHGNVPAASMCAKDVYTLDAQYVDGLMFSGEVFMKMQRWGEASGKFNEALMYDPTNIKAMKRLAFVYKNVNPYSALEYLDKIKETDPDYTEADKQKGDIYYKLDDYKNANECYAKYYAATPKTAEALDIVSCENYLLSLYSLSSTDETNFDKIISIANEIQPLAPNDIIIPRMKFFSKFAQVQTSMHYEQALAEAKEAGAYVYNKQFADSVYMYQDYEVVAQLAKEEGNKEDAIKYYELAVADLEKKAESITDEKKLANNKKNRGSDLYEISNLYVRNKQAEKGIEAYQKYLDLLGADADISDKYTLATKYAAAAQEGNAEYKEKAIAAFKEVTATEATNRLPAVLANQQLARLVNTDSSKPIAEVKDYYEKALAEADTNEETKTKAKNARWEACRYLFFYYVSIEPADKASATKYANIAKEIKPDDTFVKDAFAHLKTM